MNNEVDSEILTIGQVGQVLNLERHHVSRLIKAGLIPSITLSPRVVRVPRWLLIQRLDQLALLACRDSKETEAKR